MSARTTIARLFGAILVAGLSVACTGGGGRGNAGLNSGTLGLRINKLVGDNQSVLPGKVFDLPLQISLTSDDGKPVANATVKFKQTTSTTAVVLTDTVTTDSNGQAETHVRAATAYNTSMVIQASVDGTTLTADFNLMTAVNGVPTAITVNTTNLLIERAGVGFSYIFTVTDDAGNTVTSFDNQDLDLSLTFLTDVSWSEKIANLPPAIYRCHFTQGLCQTSAIYNLVDATKPTYLSVGAGSLRPILNQEIQVINSALGGIVIADQAGGPAAGALPVKAFENLTVLNTDMPPMTLYASLVDLGGNYMREAQAADGVTWTGETKILNTVYAPLNTDLTPQGGGGSVAYGITKSIILPNTGRIHAQAPNLQDFVTGNIQVDPGVPAQLVVGTLHNQIETAGVPSRATVRITDAKGNACQQTPTKAGISGTGTISGTYVNPTFGAQTTLMEPLFGTDLNYNNYYPLGSQINVVMFNGTVVTAPLVTLPRGQRTPAAVAVKPQLSVTLTVPPIQDITGGFTLTGVSAPITVLPGSPSRLSVRRVAAGSPSASDPVVCDRLWQFWVGNNTPQNGCQEFNVSAGATTRTYYSIVEDLGGNPLGWTGSAWAMADDAGTPVETVITKFDALNAAFFDFNPKDNVSRTTYTPNTAGSGALVLRYTDASKGVNIATQYDTFTRTGGVDHFYLSYTDGAHGSNNLVSATNPITMYIEARDISDNLVVGFNGGVNMNFAISPNILASPKGTAANFPTSMVVNFSAGSATVNGLRIPNASVNHIETVRASATISSSLASSNTVTLQVDPGPDNRLAIRDQANGNGNDLTNATVAVNADVAPSYFAIVYDAENNVSNLSPVVNWTDTFTMTTSPTPIKRATYPATGSQTNFTLQNGCAGVNIGLLKATYNALSVSTGQFTISAGAYAKLNIYPAGGSANLSPTAGAATPFRVVMVDNLYNPVPYSGSKNFNFSVVNNAGTRLGYSHLTPPNGGYTVTNGVVTPDVQFTFYNNTLTPKAEVDDPSVTPIITGQSAYLNVQNDLPNNFYVRRNTTNMAAGSTQLFRFYLQDQWGNRMLQPVSISGTPTDFSTANVTVSFLSALGGQDATSYSLGSASKNATTKAVTGTLSAAQATVNVTATQSGQLQMNAVVNGYTLPAANEREDVTVDPLSTVDHLVFSTAEPPSATYTASKTTPMNEFQVEERDVYNNRITTDNSSNIVISVPSAAPGTPGTLTGTTTKQVVLGLATFSDLKYPRAHVITLQATHPVSGKTVSANVTVGPNLPQQAVVILPGQTLVEGVNSPAAAVTGTPSSQLVDVPYNVDIYAVDEVYNRVTSYTGIAAIGSVTGDPNVAVSPPNQNFASAKATFAVTDRKTGVLQIVPSTSLLFNSPSSGFAVNPGTPTRLVTVMPGQTLNQGALSLSAAVTGTPTAQTAGTPFTTTVYATDKYYNVVNDSTTTVSLALTDANGSFDNSSTNLPLTNGSVSFVATRFIKSQSGAVITPAVVTSPNTYSSLNASSPFLVNPAGATQAIAYLPAYQSFATGQTGLAAAVTGTIPTITAGQLVNINVVVADAYYNPVGSYGSAVGLNLSDTNAALVGAVTPTSGVANFTGIQYITSTNGAATAKATPNATGLTNVASSSFVVAPNAVRQTLVVLPGQTYAPGKTNQAAAVINAAQAQTAGVAYNVGVYMVDQFFNQVTSDSSTSVGINLDDTTATPPANQTLASGVATFSVTNTRAGAQAMRATSAQTNLNSSTYLVNPNTVTQAFVRLPGQTLNPGYSSFSSALTGAPNAQTAGVAFNADVIATDNWFNQVTTYNGTGLTLTLDDPNATNPAATSFAGGIRTFSVTNYTASNVRSISIASSLATNRTSTTYVVNPNATGIQLVTTLPGQVIAPGKQTYATAVSGTIPPVDADVTFTVTVSARDAYFNLINDSSTSVTLGSPTDMFALFTPTSGLLSSGSRSFNVKNHHARYNTLKAANVGAYTGTVSSQYWINWLADFNLVALLPGQTLNEGASTLVPSAYGTATNAVTGTPSAQTAGVTMPVNVFVTDKFFNHTDRGGSYTAQIATPNDASASMPAAFTLANNNVDNATNTTQYAPLKAGAQFVRPSLASGSIGGTAYDSSSFTLGSATATQTVIAMAGQTLVPGSTSLATALPNTVYSINTDANVNVTAFVTDAYFNPVTNMGGTGFTLSSLTDTNQTTYAGTFNASGQATVSVEPVTPGSSHQYKITTMSGGLTHNAGETFAVTLGTPTFLVLKHPGETFTPARRTGLVAIAGAPNTESAGTGFGLSIYLTDKKYNVINSGAPSTWSVALSAPNDGYAVGTGAVTLSAGQFTQTINNHVAAASQTLVATTANAPLTGTNFNSSAYTVIPGTATQTVAVLPGQTLTPGPTALGTALTGTATWVASSTGRAVSVKLTDQFFNVVSSNSAGVSLSDGLEASSVSPSTPISFAAGSAAFTATTYRAGSHVFTPSYGGLTANPSTATVTPGAATQTIVYYPEQTYTPGSQTFAAAVTGAVTPRNADTTPSVTVRAVDQYFNTVPGTTGAFTLTTSDPVDTDPTGTFSSGQASVTITPVRVGTWTAGVAGFGTANATSYAVTPGAATQLIPVLAGQSWVPGQTSLAAAVTGTGTTQTVNVSFNADVYLADQHFNAVTGTAGNVALTLPTDGQGVVATSPVALNTSTGRASFTVTNKTRGSAHQVRATSGLVAGTYNSSTYAVGAGAPTQLIVLLPGQNLVEGQSSAATAITGTPSTATAGQSFTATVKAVDANFNQSSAYTGTVSLTSSDPNYVVSAAQAISSGTLASLSFTVTNKTATGGGAPAGWTLTPGAGGETPTTTKVASNSYPVVPGAAFKIMVGVGTSQGLNYVGTGGVGFAVTGATTAATVNANYPVTLYSTDQWNNKTSDSTTQVGVVSASDTFATTPAVVTMSAGSATLNFVHHKAGSGFTLTTSNTASLTNTGSSTYVANPAAPTQLVTLVPGESLSNPGASTRAVAVSGTTSAQVAGAAFTTSVYLTDLYFNTVTGTAANVSLTSTTDSAATVATSPAAVNTSTGIASFSVTNNTRATGQVVRATTTLFAGTYDSSTYAVGAGAPTQLIVLLPGQSLVEGQSSASAAITGTPSTATAGAAFNVTVKAVDARFNQSSAYAGTVSLTSTDPNYVASAAQSISNGSLASLTFTVTNKTATGGAAPAGWTLTPGASGETPTTTKLTSSAYATTAGSANRILLAAGGQTLGYVGTGGVGYAITGSTTAATVNANYAVKVYSTDQWNNKTTDSTTQASVTSASDTYASTPANVTMSSGQATVNFVHHKAGTGFTLTTTNTASLTNTGSSTYTANPAAASQLLTLLPGESLGSPGASTRAAAITGSPAAQSAGGAFPASVYLTDLYFNVVSGTAANVSLTSTTDSTATVATSPAAVNTSTGIASFSVTNNTRGTGQVVRATTTLFAGTYDSSSYLVNAGAPTRLIVLLPGQSLVEGQSSAATAISGTPSAATAGAAFNVTVKAVDANFNQSSAYAGTVSLTSTDPNYAVSAAQAVSNGTTASLTFTVTNKTATGGSAPAGWTLTAGASGETPTTTKLASSAYATTAGSANRILIGAAGQTLGYVGTGGVGYAITGSTTAATVNANYAVTLYSVDQWNNKTTDSTTQASVTSASDTFASTPSNVTMSSGQTSVNFVHHKAGTGFTLTSTNGASLTNSGSSTYTVNAAAASQLLTLLPGETLGTPGASTRAAAITGTPAAQAAGTAFNVSVYLTDLYFNAVTGTAANVALTSTTDASATVATSPVAVNTSTGVATLSLTNRTRGTAHVARATTTLFGGNFDSTTYAVNAGAPTRLITLLPGQSLVEGQSSAAAAITGAPTPTVAGASFSVTVKAVDANFNQSSAYTGTVSLAGTDPNYAVSAAQAITNGTVASVTFTVTDKTATGGAAPAGWTLTAGASGETPTTTKLASSAYSATAGSANRILIGAGGQTLGYVGSGGVGFAVTGTPAAATVNAAYASNVYSTDQWNNLTNDSTTQASLASTYDTYAAAPSNQTLTAGTATVNFVHHKAGTNFILGTTNTAALTNTNSSTFNVNPAAASQMLVLMPGQSLANPGASTRAAAVGGTVGAITAGTAFAVNALVTDLYYNVITNNSGLGSRNVTLAFTGDSGTPPAAVAPVNCGAGGGCTATFPSVTNVTAGSGHAITASLAAGAPSVSNDTSTSYTVGAAGPAHLFVVLPGESYVAGNATVSGTASNETAGTAFGVTLKLTDQYYNDVSYAGSPSVTITSTAANAPNGTAPTLGSFSGSFAAGVATVSGFTFTQAVNTAKISAAIPSLGLSTVASNVVPVTAAALSSLTIRSAAAGAGSPVTTATYSTSDSAPNYYAAGYDGYGNLRGDTNVNWTATRAASADLNSALSATTATSTSLNLGTAGAGTLTVSATDAGGSGTTTSTGTLTILDQGASSFTVTVAGPATAGSSFNVVVTAKGTDGTTTATGYAGTKTISMSSTATLSTTNACGGGSTTVTLPTSASFTGGQATIALTLNKIETGRTVTVGATNVTSGTSGGFDVQAGAAACLLLRTAAGGAGSAIGSSLSWSIDDSQVFYAAGYDAAGNYVADQTANWSGTGELAGLPYPASANAWSRLVGVKSGSGGVLTANAAGLTKTVTINVGAGSRTITSATVDSSTTRHLLQSDAVVDVKAWTPGSDATSGWLGDNTRSWYAQASSPDADRGVRYDFPAKVHVVANASAVSIIDATTNDLFLRFDAGANYALDSNLGAVTKVDALDGKLFIGMSGGLTIVDFTTDAIYKITTGSTQKASGLGAGRNAAMSWSADGTYPTLPGAPVAALSAQRVGGQDYLAIGTGAGVTLMKTSGTSASCTNSGSTVTAARLTTGGTLYYAAAGVAVVSPNLGALSGSCGSPAATYDLSLNARLPSLNIRAIDVAEGLSSANSGSNVIEVATSRGLTVVQEGASAAGSTSRTYVATAGGLYGGHARLNQTAITAPDNGTLTTQGTLEFYFRPDTTYDSGLAQNMVLAQKGDGTRNTEGNLGVELVAGSGVVEFYVVINGTARVVDSSAPLTAGAWSHVAVQVNAAGTLDLWVNGVNQTNASGQTVTTLSNGTLYFGGGTAPATTGVNGAFDDARVSAVTRYTSGTALTVPSAAFVNDGATGYLYHFDDNQGVTAVDASANATPASLASGAVFATPLFAGTSNNVVALRGVSRNGHATALMVTGTTGQVSELRSVEAPGTASLGSTAAAGSASAVDVFQINSETSYDWLLGTAGGLTLNRR